MVERYRERNKREDRRAGEIVALLYNVNRDSEKMPDGIEWTDIFPEWKEEQTEGEGQTEEEMLNVMFALKASTEGLSH